jgi:hypothetical protein
MEVQENYAWVIRDIRHASTPPFVDAGPSEVAARVTYQLIRLDFHRNPSRYTHPAEGIHQLAVQLRSYQDTFVQTCFAAAGAYLSAHRGSLKQWRDQIIYRSRYHVAARRAGRPWNKAPTPVLLTGGSVDANLRTITGGDEVRPWKPGKERRRRGR